VVSTLRIDDRDEQIGPEERQIIVAAIPDDQIRFAFRLA